MLIVAVEVYSHNHTTVVDPFGHGQGRARRVESRVGAVLAQQETMAFVRGGCVNVVAYYLSRIVDPEGDSPQHRIVAGYVDHRIDEVASAPEKAMTFHV